MYNEIIINIANNLLKYKDEIIEKINELEKISKEDAGKALFELASACELSGIDAEEALTEYTERMIKEYADKVADNPWGFDFYFNRVVLEIDSTNYNSVQGVTLPE